MSYTYRLDSSISGALEGLPEHPGMSCRSVARYARSLTIYVGAPIAGTSVDLAKIPETLPNLYLKTTERVRTSLLWLRSVA